MIALGGPTPPPPRWARVPADMGVSRVEVAGKYPWSKPRLIGWVLWEVHGVVVEKKGMLYARTDGQP
jgi:hypothetical protein